MFDGQFFPAGGNVGIQFEGGRPFNRYRGKDAKEIVDLLGIGTALEICADVGDSSSYDGSSQTWLDLSGNGYDFFRGTTNGADATDPTFNGSSGGLSSADYWSFDGGDYFTYDTTNETWMDNIHKDNALFSYICWIYPAGAAQNGICGTAQPTTQVGFGSNINTSNGVLNFNISNGSGTLARSISPNLGAADGAWQMAAYSIDEAGDVYTAFLNGTSATGAASYSSPSAAAATNTFRIATRGGASTPPPNGARMAMYLAWSRALSLSEITAFYAASRWRFGV